MNFSKTHMLPAMLLGSVALLGISSAAQASVVLVSYDFDNTSDQTEINEQNVSGTPTLTLAEVGGPAFGTTNASPDWAAAWQSTTSGTAYWQIDLNTSTYENLLIEFYNRSSGEGATSITISWGVDGGTLTDVETVSLNRSATFTQYQVDLSGITAIEDSQSVQIRGTWGTDGTAANTRLDDLSLIGTVIPEPASLALLGAAGCVLLCRRQRA